MNPRFKILLLAFPIILLLILIGFIVPEKYFAPSVNSVALILGLLYFFEKVQLDRDSATTKYKRDRINLLAVELEAHSELVSDLERSQSAQASAIKSKRDKIQTQTVKIQKLNERLRTAKIIDQSVSKPVTAYVSTVEKSELIVTDVQHFGSININNVKAKSHYAAANALDAVYESLFQLELS